MVVLEWSSLIVDLVKNEIKEVYDVYFGIFFSVHAEDPLQS
jgi:hypothetical protein